MPRKTKPITTQVIHFESYASAARHFCVSIGAVSLAVKRGRTDRLGSDPAIEPKPISVNGQHFPTHSAAAHYYGVDPRHIAGYAAVMSAIKERSTRSTQNPLT